MRKFVLLFALAAGTAALASIQGSYSISLSHDVAFDRAMRSCKALVQKMDQSPYENTLRNRIRTWKCRDELSPDTPKAMALLRETGR